MEQLVRRGRISGTGKTNYSKSYSEKKLAGKFIRGYTKGYTGKEKGISFSANPLEFFGAGNGIRTRDFDLGKVALYH